MHSGVAWSGGAADAPKFPFLEGEIEDGAVEVDDADIVCCEPVDDGRAQVRLRYRRLNAFIGDYLGRVRRGQTLMMTAPADAAEGDVIDVEIAIDGAHPFILHAEVISLWAGQATVRFVTGRLTDRIVAPVVELALGKQHAIGLLGTC